MAYGVYGITWSGRGLGPIRVRAEPEKPVRSRVRKGWWRGIRRQGLRRPSGTTESVTGPKVRVCNKAGSGQSLGLPGKKAGSQLRAGSRLAMSFSLLSKQLVCCPLVHH